MFPCLWVSSVTNPMFRLCGGCCLERVIVAHPHCFLKLFWKRCIVLILLFLVQPQSWIHLTYKQALKAVCIKITYYRLREGKKFFPSTDIFFLYSRCCISRFFLMWALHRRLVSSVILGCVRNGTIWLLCIWHVTVFWRWQLWRSFNVIRSTRSIILECILWFTRIGLSHRYVIYEYL